jgi:hypothetical protein
MNDTHIDVRIHHYTSKYDDLCVRLYLKREDYSIVDSFDIDHMTGRIRFHGCMKDYSLKRIPQCKKKLWNCTNFIQMIIEKLENAAVFNAYEYDSELYHISLNSIVDKYSV